MRHLGTRIELAFHLNTAVVYAFLKPLRLPPIVWAERNLVPGDSLPLVPPL